MPNIRIAVLDYGLGNIFSIQRAVSYLGAESFITDNPREILCADRIILPGVGAFGDGMKALREKGLDRALLECANSGKMILGICLGMQLLMGESEEFGIHKGLNLIPGRVVRFPEPIPNEIPYKIPHVGWNRIFPKSGSSDTAAWAKTVLQANTAGDFFYFIHSYIGIPENENHILAITEYGGTEFCSVIGKGHIFGCQFHPELSGGTGLKIYRTFLSTEMDMNLANTRR